MVRFYEIYRCMGVDEDAQGMVVPVGDNRSVVLESSGMDLSVVPSDRSIELKEFDGKAHLQALHDMRNMLNRPGVDDLFKAAMMPAPGRWNKPRFFRVFGKMQTGFSRTRVTAGPRSVPGRRVPSAMATLQIAVVDRMVINVAIRNVRARDPQGNMRFHANQPCDPTEELFRMNAIWTPQTNIAFDLIPSTDVVIDHDDAKTREELRRAHGMKPESRASFYAASGISPKMNGAVFAKHRVPGAHFTFFLVHQVLTGVNPETGRGGTSGFGATLPQLGIAFISGQHLPTTFAHEAGHFLGGSVKNGEWVEFPHDSPKDMRSLMRWGGAGWKIPFDQAKTFRGFFARHPVH